MTSLTANVGVTFDKLVVDVDLRVDAGEIVGLLGENGAGKTTVLRAVAGLLALDRGIIECNGTVFDDPSQNLFVEAPLRNVGVVFQDYRLFPHLSALANVAFGLRCRSVDHQGANKIAYEWLERFGLLDHAQHRPAALSGGQAQRVALARALAIEPAVLLLDEPLAAIDEASRPSMRSELRQYLQGYSGVTILVSHVASDIEALATRTVAMHRGHIV